MFDKFYDCDNTRAFRRRVEDRSGNDLTEPEPEPRKYFRLWSRGRVKKFLENPEYARNYIPRLDIKPKPRLLRVFRDINYVL